MWTLRSQCVWVLQSSNACSFYMICRNPLCTSYIEHFTKVTVPVKWIITFVHNQSPSITQHHLSLIDQSTTSISFNIIENMMINYPNPKIINRKTNPLTKHHTRNRVEHLSPHYILVEWGISSTSLVNNFVWRNKIIPL